MIWLYRLLYLPGLLIALPYYLFRMMRRGGYAKSFHHRFGFFPKLRPSADGKIRIWLQAVSVGEILAIQTLLLKLQEKEKFEIVLTTTTSTAYKEAIKLYSESITSIGIFPLDFLPFNYLAWKKIRPHVIVMAESELWPEHLQRAKISNTPAYLINARISDRSFRLYKIFPSFSQGILNNFRAIYAASYLDQDRLLTLGCSNNKIYMTGNIKLDVSFREPITSTEMWSLRESLGFGGNSAFVLLGSSTWPGEEIALLDAQRAAIEQGTDCRLLLVPRHAERRYEIIKLLKSQKLSWFQRSKQQVPDYNLSIHLADTTGELSYLTQAADLAFIGKSLAPNLGGQTPIEAASIGIPTLMGPNMNNFREIAESIKKMGAGKFVSDPKELTRSVIYLSKNKAKLDEMRSAAISWHKSNLGSSSRTAKHLIADLLKN